MDAVDCVLVAREELLAEHLLRAKVRVRKVRVRARVSVRARVRARARARELLA